MSEKKCFHSDKKISIAVIDGIPARLRDSALSLFWAVFSQKFQRTLGHESKALPFLQRCIAPEQAICAVDSSGQLIGLATIKSDGYGFIHPTLADFYAEYGTVGGFMRALIMNRLDYKPDKNEMMIESICVDESARGMGIGQVLISYIKDLAQKQKKTNVTLDVIANNLGAYRLYERIDFREIGRKSFLFLVPVFSFRQAIRMQFSHDIADPVSSQQ